MDSTTKQIRSALHVRDFRVLWIGTLSSFVAFFMSTIVQSVVAFQLAGTNRAVGYAIFAQGIAMAGLGPLGGTIADRLPKRRVIAIGQISSAAVFTVLGYLVYTETIELGHLIAGSFLVGAAFSFFGPARQALVIDLVPATMRGNAMALSNVANTSSRVVGPILAGVLLGWPGVGAAGAYLCMAVFYSISALSLLMLPQSKVRADAADKPIWADLANGLRYVRSHPVLQVLVVFYVGVILLGFPYTTVLPGLLENELGHPANQISTLMMVTALGALSASLVVTRFANSASARVIYGVGAVAFGVSLLGLAIAPSFEIILLVMFAIGLSSGAFQTLNGAVIARESDPVYIGRVMSLTFLAFAGFGLMGLPVGLLADAWGERTTLGLLGVAVVALSLWLSRVLARRSGLPRDSGSSL